MNRKTQTTKAEKPNIWGARIVQLMPAPAVLTDDDGNLFVGFALVEIDLDWGDGVREKNLDIFPIGNDGGIDGLPDDAFYKVHALGDYRTTEFLTPWQADREEDRNR